MCATDRSMAAECFNISHRTLGLRRTSIPAYLAAVLWPWLIAVSVGPSTGALRTSTSSVHFRLSFKADLDGSYFETMCSPSCNQHGSTCSSAKPPQDFCFMDQRSLVICPKRPTNVRQPVRLRSGLDQLGLLRHTPATWLTTLASHPTLWLNAC
ncbi:hypothetical protein FB567DRAFT_55910 [Paraphoma chrysanthemicola]|uniref:Uncharacterized protein n=1 Tax=Paraphoma chrysanthemicola TaxID=798071 RepID=A0A8K0VYZ5_9PLEO|nr:hypothetical protein FB567DRAFT_55910 [Paraphoma chrysanthemicola]